MTIATKKINENSAAPNKGRTYGAIAQLGERLPCKQEVGSSILPGSTTMLYWLSWRLCGSAHYFYYYLSQKPIGCRRGFSDVQLLRQMRLP